ncbi:uncharacterized protein [Nerophis lumbriciformis]|uniref:uncharacterized protein isoform X1 n=1 Tax=Nerophis lumbriciformis TaxID=546530 RepID=UPI003BAA201E
MPGKMCHGFKPGDLVFAKMKGFPHWPARVCKSDDAHKKRVPVFFFGTHQIGHIPQENIVPFSGNKLKYGSGVRIKGFTEGMWEIQNTPGVGSKSKITAKTVSKTTLAKSTAASKTTSAARSTPSKRTFTSSSSTKATSSGRTSRANLNVGAKSTAVKPVCDVETSPLEATSKIESLPAASTVELMACAAECVPAQMSLRISTSKSHQEASLSKAEDVPRRSSSRSAAQTPTDDLPQKSSSPKGGASAEGRRRGRSRKPPKEKIAVEQAADNQTSGVPMTEEHDASMEDLKCKKKSRSSTGPATRLTGTASEPVSTLIKRAKGTKRPRKSWSPSTAQLPAEVLHIPQKSSKPNDGAAAEVRRRGRSKTFAVKKSQSTDAPLISQIDPLCKTHNHISQTATTLTPSSICIDAQEETEPEEKDKQLDKMPVEEQLMDLREKTQPEKEKQQMQEAEESTGTRGANRKKTKEPLEEEKKQLVEMPEENQQLEEKSKKLNEESITEKEVERRRNEDEEMEKKKALEEENKQQDKMPEEEQKEVEENTRLGEENQKKLVKESPMSSLVKRLTQEEEEEKQLDKMPDVEQRETQEKMRIGEEKQNELEEELPMSSVVKGLTQEEEQPNKMSDEEQRETQEKMRRGEKKQKELEEESPMSSLVKSNTQEEEEEKKKQPGKIPGEEQEKLRQGEENQKELEEKSSMSRKIKKKIEEQQKDLIEKIQPGEEKQLLENAEESTGKRGAKRKRKKEEMESGEEKIPQGEANRRLEEKMVPEEKSITRRGAERKKNEDKETEKKKTSEGEKKQPDKMPEKTRRREEKQNTLEEESAMSKGVKKRTDEKQKNQLEEKHKDLETKSTTSKGVQRKRKEEERKQGEEEQKKRGEESTVSRGAEGKRKDKTKDPQEPKKQVEEEQMVLAEDSTRRRVERKRKEEIQQEGSVVAKAEEAITAEKKSRRKSEEGGSKKRRKEQEAAEERKKRRKEKATEDRREARRKSRKDKDTRERGRTTEAEKDGAKKGHVDEERQQRLAAKRESLLKSLRGLMKESSPKSITKSTNRSKTTARSHKMLKESSVRKKGFKVRGSQLLVKEAKKNQDATQSKKSAGQSDDSKVKEKTQADEKKLIGKIVKATTKVQVKTMLGGATLQEEQRKKTLKADDTKLQRSSKEARKPERLTTNDKSARNGGGDQEGKSKLRDDAKDNVEERKKGDKMATSEKDGNAASKLAKQHSGGRSHKQTTHATMQSGVSSGDAAEDSQQQKNNSNLTLIDSTLHRIHGDIRISLKGDNPDVSKCLAALDQLSGIYVTSQHVQRHSELVSTLRKMRFYRANQDIMDKAAMLYNRFKNAFLLGEDQEVVSAAFLRSLLEEKEREKAVCCDEGAGLEQKQWTEPTIVFSSLTDTSAQGPTSFRSFVQ